MQRNQPGPVPLPDVAELAQDVAGVMHRRRRHDADGVEFLGLGEHWLAVLVHELGEARNDAAPVPAHTRRTALPVAKAGLVGVLELTEQVDHHVLVFRQALQAGHEARPGTALELVEHRGVVHLLGHDAFSVVKLKLLINDSGHGMRLRAHTRTTMTDCVIIRDAGAAMRATVPRPWAAPATLRCTP